jgi:hypothetical protein
MRRFDLASALAVLLAAGLVLLARPATPHPVTAAAPHAVPVEHTTLVCPGADAAQTVIAAVTSTPRGSAEPAASPVRIDSGDGRPVELHRRGTTWSGAAAALRDGLEVSADGSLAAGLEAASAAVFEGAPRGLAATSCPTPAAHWWFPGAASTVERSGVLQLANPTSGVAVVDVTFRGPHGMLGSAATGLLVPPRGRTSLPLANAVPGVTNVAVEVTAQQGQVAAALTETRREGLEPAGVDLLPPAAEPRRTTVLTGLPGDAQEHTITVANAGNAAAVVDMEVLGPRGAFTPTSLDSLRVPAGAVAQTALPAAVLDGATVGLRLTSDQPITASASSSNGGPLADQSFAASAEPVDTVTGTPVLPGLDGELVLSGAGQTAAIVDVVTYSPAGAPLRHRTLDVHSGQTRTVPLTDAGASVTVRVGGSGPVAAAVLWSRPDQDGTLTSGYPLAPARLTVPRPAVRYRLVPAQPS